VLLLLVALDQQGLLQTHTVSGPVWEHFDFSLLHADYDDGFQLGRDRPDLFGDLRTRQAVARCLDRESVIKQVVYGMSDSDYQNLYPGGPIDVSSFGSSEASNAYIPVDHPLYNPGIPAYPFSPDEANALLEEVGWIDHDDDASTPRQANSIPNVPDGTLFEFDYLTTSSAQRKQTAQILIDSLSKCGIKVNTQHVDAVEFYELPGSPVFSRNFDVAEFAWLTGEIPTCELFLTENIPGDPEELNPDGAPRFPRGWEGENNSGYSSIEFDRACRAAAAALPGQQGFVEHHMLAQEIFTRDLPVIPLFQRLKVTAARADMCGYEMDATAISDTWNIEAFGLGDECEN
jgi:peptide/nickel transport system substrate-binding protein